MAESNRILFMGREWASMDTVTRILEAVGCTVTSTVSDAVAIDLAGSSDYAALIIDDEVPQADSRYVIREARKMKHSLAVIKVSSPESVLTQLQQAGVRL
jgi:DNA-binding response OmpR family regulator